MLLANCTLNTKSSLSTHILRLIPKNSHIPISCFLIWWKWFYICSILSAFIIFSCRHAWFRRSLGPAGSLSSSFWSVLYLFSPLFPSLEECPVENQTSKPQTYFLGELLRALPSWQHHPFFRCCCWGYLCFACYTAVIQTFIILL
jgi:hypothetical protein